MMTKMNMLLMSTFIVVILWITIGIAIGIETLNQEEKTVQELITCTSPFDKHIYTNYRYHEDGTILVEVNHNVVRIYLNEDCEIRRT